MKVYNQIKFEERKSLYVMKQEGTKVSAMAIGLRRHRSTIYRELKRNCDDKLGYLPDTAHHTMVRRKAKHPAKPVKNKLLFNMVIDKLKLGWSPEIIAGKLRTEQSKERISTEAIYQFIYSDQGNQLGLYQYLEKAKPKRLKRQGRTPRKPLIPNRISVHDRPDITGQSGHFEGDLTFNYGNQSVNLLVAIEKQSRYIKITKNKSKKALEVGKNLLNLVATFPKDFVKTVTFDNGVEFVKHRALHDFFGIQTYFCDPHSPWQKPQVENVNRLIHKYIPNNIPLSRFSDKKVQEVEHYLNNRPRKCLNFKTPNEVFYELVALRP